jgi:hypothetical protein
MRRYNELMKRRERGRNDKQNGEREREKDTTMMIKTRARKRFGDLKMSHSYFFHE